jgi:type II secretory pathway component HofQ
MPEKRRFKNGDIVAMMFRGKWHVYTYRTLHSFHTYPRIWFKGDAPVKTNVVLTDFRGNVRRVKFKEENLRLANELIATLTAELDTFRNRR